jgi:hypothetical protein
MACDLENVYLNTRCKEKILFEGRIECGANKLCIFVHALYGLKSAGASWHATLVQALHDIGFVSTTADPDVWIWAAVQGDGFEYYEMLFVYVEDVLMLSHQPKVLIDAIGEYNKVNLEVIKNLKSILEQILRKCRCQMVGKYGPAHLVIMSIMLLRPLRVCLKKMVKGMY